MKSKSSHIILPKHAIKWSPPPKRSSSKELTPVPQFTLGEPSTSINIFLQPIPQADALPEIVQVIEPEGGNVL